MRLFRSYEELADSVGLEIGPSDWITVGQDRPACIAKAIALLLTDPQ